ncbi:MAG TPA: TolC family protein [Armatimonadota bacterium]|jgi:TolC family type I secretion outer membrane protein
MKCIRHEYLLAISLAVSLAAGGAARPAADTAVDLSQPLTLERAVQITLQRQQRIGVARSQWDAAKARVTQAKSAWYPSVGPSYSYSQQVTTQSTPSGKQTGTYTQNVAQIGLQQTIFDMGKRELNVAISKESARAAAYNVLDTRQSVILSVETGWYDLLRQRDLVRVAESSADRAKATLDSTRAFVEAGSSARKDVLQAEADYETAQVQVIEARNNALLAQTSLKNAMGITSAEALTLPADAVATPDTTADEKASADYVERALASRPDLMGTDASISATQKSVRVARIEAGPQIESSVSEGYRIHPDSGENRTLSATISYPLFDAGATRARVRETQASLSQAEQQRELSRQNISAAVESAYLQREAAKRRILASQAAQKAAQENFAAAAQSQNEGVGTVLDVITAQNALVTAETNAVTAVYDYYTANATLQREVGQNDPGAERGGTL